MLFILDNDVDVAVAKFLRRNGHRVHTAHEIGLADASDDDLAISVDDRGGVLVTHDKEFSGRRRRFVYGRHVQLRTTDSDAAEVFVQQYETIMELPEAGKDVWVRVSRREATPDWGTSR